MVSPMTDAARHHDIDVARPPVAQQQSVHDEQDQQRQPDPGRVHDRGPDPPTGGDTIAVTTQQAAAAIASSPTNGIIRGPELIQEERVFECDLTQAAMPVLAPPCPAPMLVFMMSMPSRAEWSRSRAIPFGGFPVVDTRIVQSRRHQQVRVGLRVTLS